MLSLKPEDAERLHPEALRWFNDQRATIEHEVPLEELSDDDLNTFLSDEEKNEFLRLKDEVARELTHCIDIEQRVPPGPLAEATIGFTVLKSQLGLLAPMDHLRSLLMKAYNRKKEAQRKRENEERRLAEKVKEEASRRQEQAEAEQRKKKEEERRNLAFKDICPPMADAKKYLNHPGEYDKFITSIDGAIDAYLTVGEDYLNHTKASEYQWYLITIRDRRQKEAHKLQATRAANEYNHRLNQEIAKLTSRLDHRFKDLSSYFRAKILDKRFTGHSFDYVLSAEDKGNFDGTLVSVANRKLLQFIPDDLRQFVGLPSQYHRLYFPLPAASYSFEEVPSLEFLFEIFSAAYAEVWLKPGKKSFGGYEFFLPQIEEKDYSVTLQKPKSLGYYYLILRPEDLGGYVFWESIPLILLKGLLNGEIKPEGTTISAASDEEVTYRIPKVEDEITIPNSFAGYLKTLGTIDKMVGMDIMSEKVASIVKAELNELKAELDVPPLGQDKMKRGDTKKARACERFNQGKRPGDPEVKALGIKPETAYRYYQDWKKAQNLT